MTTTSSSFLSSRTTTESVDLVETFFEGSTCGFWVSDCKSLKAFRNDDCIDATFDEFLDDFGIIVDFDFNKFVEPSSPVDVLKFFPFCLGVSIGKVELSVLTETFGVAVKVDWSKIFFCDDVRLPVVFSSMFEESLLESADLSRLDPSSDDFFGAFQGVLFRVHGPISSGLIETLASKDGSSEDFFLLFGPGLAFLTDFGVDEVDGICIALDDLLASDLVE